MGPDDIGPPKGPEQVTTKIGYSTIAFCLVFLLGCSIQERPSGSGGMNALLHEGARLTSKTESWEIRVSRKIGNLYDFRINSAVADFSFDAPMRERDVPNRYKGAGTSFSEYGYYNPSFNFTDSLGKDVRVTLSNSAMNFPNVENANHFLGWEFYRIKSPTAVNIHGQMASVFIDESTDSKSYDIRIKLAQIYISGKPCKDLPIQGQIAITSDGNSR